MACEILIDEITTSGIKAALMNCLNKHRKNDGDHFDLLLPENSRTETQTQTDINVRSINKESRGNIANRQ